MIVFHNEADVFEMGPGVTRKNLSHGGALMAVEFTFKKDSSGAVHSHPHEQIGYIVDGTFELEMDGRKQNVQTGDTYYVPPHCKHGVVALTDGKILDVFTPVREDFLNQQK